MTGTGMSDLVERQVRKWEEAARIAPGPRGGVAVAQPVIAISREFGALGSEIGRMVAYRMDFEYFDRKLVELIAAESHVVERMIDLVDERLQDRITNWVADQFGRGVTNATLVRNIGRLLLTIACHGRAVIVGRGAQFVLDPATTLRVRARASLDVRVERIAVIGHLTRDQALARVREVDAERHAFCRTAFGREVAEPEAYDLVLDTGTLPMDACADLVILAFRARFGAS